MGSTFSYTNTSATITKRNFNNEQVLNKKNFEKLKIRYLIDLKADLEAIGEVTQLQAPVALIFDYPSQWATDTQAQGANFYYFNLVYQAYQVLRRLGVDVDVISKNQDLDGYKIAIVPSLFTLDSEFLNFFTKTN